MWKTVSYSGFVQWCSQVLWAERKALGNRELPRWSECKCSWNLKRAECFSRARVYHSATLFLRLPGARQRQQQQQLFPSSAALRMEKLRQKIVHLFSVSPRVPWAPGWLQWLWASPASSPTAPCASFRAGRLSPRIPLHHPLLACLSPAKNNILAEKSIHGWHYLVQDENTLPFSLSPASLVFNSYVISFFSSIFSFLCCFVQGCWIVIVMLHNHWQPLPQGSSP